MKFTRYRDRKTGRFVKQATWRRSKAHGGSRFVRSRIVIKAARKPSARKQPTRLALPPKLYEWLVTVLPSKSADRQIDFVVTAPTEASALPALREFLRHDPRGANMVSFFVVENIARGKESEHQAGYVEYRGESEE
jgi:hypothetical protein